MFRARALSDHPEIISRWTHLMEASPANQKLFLPPFPPKHSLTASSEFRLDSPLNYRWYQFPLAVTESLQPVYFQIDLIFYLPQLKIIPHSHKLAEGNRMIADWVKLNVVEAF